MADDEQSELVEGITLSLQRFRDGLKRHANPLQVVREFITHGPCVAINSKDHAQLRESVAAELGVNPNQNVYTVGSAKLGFSIKPNNRYRHFGEESDVDVAVVSSELYNHLWCEARDFVASKTYWHGKGRERLKSTHLYGSIHPSIFPRSDQIPTAKKLWELGRQLQSQRTAGPYKVTFVVWHDMEALESYQSRAVLACQESEMQ